MHLDSECRLFLFLTTALYHLYTRGITISRSGGGGDLEVLLVCPPCFNRWEKVGPS